MDLESQVDGAIYQSVEQTHQRGSVSACKLVSKRVHSYCDISNIQPIEDSAQLPRGEDLLTLMTFDLEIYMKDGKFDASGMNPNNEIICICGTIGSISGANQQRYCITTTAQQQNVADVFIQCSNEQQMIHEFWKLVSQHDPVFMTGFNDSGFDIPYLRDKQAFYKEEISGSHLLPFFCFLQGRDICVVGNGANSHTVHVDNGVLERKSVTNLQYEKLLKHCQKHVFEE